MFARNQELFIPRKKVQFIERQFRDKNDNKIATFYDVIYQVLASNKKKRNKNTTQFKRSSNIKKHFLQLCIYVSFLFE